MTTEEPSKEQLAKLPLWAQQAFAILKQELRSARGVISTLRAAVNEVSPEGMSGVITWSDIQEDFVLPDGASVRFHEGGFGDKEHQRYIEVGFSESSLGGRALIVRGSAGIVIQPQAGNVVAVRVRKHGLDE
jgi:hypothetical protein